MGEDSRCPECGELGHGGCYEAGMRAGNERADRWKKVADESDRKLYDLRLRVSALARELDDLA